ncbi:MAG: ABC transporter permease [Anaerolineae bacterium]|nr:ABC transporter permease [Anaerolineae bacterium]
MPVFILRRLIAAVPTLFGITIISFMLILAAPGDPVSMLAFSPNATPEGLEQQRRLLGLDQPPLTQYIYWLLGNEFTQIDVNGDGTPDVQGTRRGLLRGDLGLSITYERPVLDLIVERIPATLRLTVPSFLIVYILGITIGMLSAVNHNGWFDQLARVLSMLGTVVPSFWLALILIIIFSVQLGVLPLTGMRDVTSKGELSLAEMIPYMIMPITVLSFGAIGSLIRYVRASALEVLNQDYVRTAQAKGLPNRAVWWRHVVRNALTPVATFIGPAIGGMLSGAVIIETIFSWPGMGRLTIQAAVARDYPLVMGFVLIGAVLYIIGLIISDVLYGLLDPRIRLN